MKRLSLFVSAFALALGVSQCRKPNMPGMNIGNGETQHVVLNASWDNGGSKIADDNAGGLKWTADDKITAQQAGQEATTLTCTNADKGAFEGDIIADPEGEKIIFTFCTENFKSGYKNQTGALNDAIKLTGEAPFDADGNYIVNMTMPHAVLKLDLSYFAPSSSKTDVTVEISKKAASKAESVLIASVTCASDKLGEVYVAVPVNKKEATATYTFSDGSGKTVDMPWPVFVGGTFYTADNGSGTGGGIVIKPAAPTGRFSVAANTKVDFAPGNLYWDGSAFRFETNQWSFASTWDASHVSHFKWSDAANAVTTDYNYSGDLFCANNFTVTGDSHTDWRTLSDAEWGYLLGTANPSRANATSLCAWKDLGGGVKGLVILPDGTDASVMDNIISTSDLATSGAVFLPAAGRRNGSSLYEVGSGGFCWSSACNGSSNAYLMYFYSSSVMPYDLGRDYGFSVRLVR